MGVDVCVRVCVRCSLKTMHNHHSHEWGTEMAARYEARRASVSEQCRRQHIERRTPRNWRSVSLCGDAYTETERERGERDRPILKVCLFVRIYNDCKYSHVPAHPNAIDISHNLVTTPRRRDAGTTAQAPPVSVCIGVWSVLLFLFVYIFRLDGRRRRWVGSLCRPERSWIRSNIC